MRTDYRRFCFVKNINWGKTLLLFAVIKEAFAVIKEAFFKALSIRIFDVQTAPGVNHAPGANYVPSANYPKKS